MRARLRYFGYKPGRTCPVLNGEYDTGKVCAGMTGAGAAFGEELRAERVRLGVSLERLSGETKVHARHLEELERGEFKALPGGVLRRGIVRAYVQTLRLEEPVWMERFQASYAELMQAEGGEAVPAEQAWVTFAENVRQNRGTRRKPADARWMGIAALFGAVFAAACAVWHFVLRTRISS